jgi:hypothetical protein
MSPLRFGNSRADYDIVRVEHDRVFIIDLDLGNKSVTNDADYVWSEIQSMWPGRRLIYRDSAGRWDEIIFQPSMSFVAEDGSSVRSPIIADTMAFIAYQEHVPNI